MVDPVANVALRQHVTRVGFDLSLGKTHIAALVFLDHGIRYRTHAPTPSGPHSPFRWFVPGVQGLETRGLIVHHFDQRWALKGGPGNHLGRHYSITKAGRLVRDLLKEAGIWQEYQAMLPAPRALEAS